MLDYEALVKDPSSLGTMSPEELRRIHRTTTVLSVLTNPLVARLDTLELIRLSRTAPGAAAAEATPPFFTPEEVAAFYGMSEKSVRKKATTDAKFMALRADNGTSKLLFSGPKVMADLETRIGKRRGT